MVGNDTRNRRDLVDCVYKSLTAIRDGLGSDRADAGASVVQCRVSSIAVLRQSCSDNRLFVHVLCASQSDIPFTTRYRRLFWVDVFSNPFDF